jgi:hypothetical protein
VYVCITSGCYSTNAQHQDNLQKERWPISGAKYIDLCILYNFSVGHVLYFAAGTTSSTYYCELYKAL